MNKDNGSVFEVRFRGEDEKGLRGWKPETWDSFECSLSEARARYARLVELGREGRQVDGVIPYVVSLDRVSYHHTRERASGKRDEVRVLDCQIWQYCEEGAPVEGPAVHGIAA